eukprot:2866513-Pyramimonas_sp.AAC.1
MQQADRGIAFLRGRGLASPVILGGIGARRNWRCIAGRQEEASQNVATTGSARASFFSPRQDIDDSYTAITNVIPQHHVR